MEILLGALPSLLPKLAELLASEYNLQKEVKGGIIFLQAELESMKAALEDISKTPADKLPSQDKIWARNVRELSYDIEDNIDTFMVQVKESEVARKHGFKMFIDKALGSLMQPALRRKICTDIRDIKSRVIEVHERRRRYEVNHSVDNKPVKVDPRALVRYEQVTKLVGTDEARDEIIKILTKGKIVSIVGFGGLGKTTLANAVYKKLSSQFDCSAFVSVSQTPDMNKLFKDMFYQLAKYSTASINVIDQLREFLQDKRYFIIIDDLWEISYWNMIRCAFPDDSAEDRIITTTRIFTIAEQIGGAYEMKPLSLKNSRILMYGRIFSKEDKDKCLDQQLAEVLGRILKKCAGIPLAIITIASLLVSKGRNKLEWYDVCNSIGAGLEENSSMENLRQVLSLSYYDMPSHLRTCLLYLSMFPEDYNINKCRLIRLWVAEGFIQSGQHEKSLFEIGESYLFELINRSMVQPMYSSTEEYYRVHDMVLDLICLLSSEENFVTIRKDMHMGHLSASKKVRRLSLQNAVSGHGNPDATMSLLEHVRSVVVFPPAIDQLPKLENFIVLRVLDLGGCDLSHGYSLKYLGNLLHLRYLGLRNTGIRQLPEEIGNLRFLQTLDVSGDTIKMPSLPSTIILLTHLICLRMNYHTRVPKGIGSLTSLEYLSLLGIHHGSIVEELGHLTELRVLKIISTTKWSRGLDRSLVECLNKLHKIQYLCIEVKCSLDGWVLIAPRYLRQLGLIDCWLSRLPAWVNPSLLLNLSYLTINVRRLKQEDLEILGRLPTLRLLNLKVDHENIGIHGRFTVGAHSFPCLLRCLLVGFGGPVVFQQGAMPRLNHLSLEFPVRRETAEIRGGSDFGLGNLPSLQTFYFRFSSRGASEVEVEKAKAAVMHAIQVHPNHLTFRDYFVY